MRVLVLTLLTAVLYLAAGPAAAQFARATPPPIGNPMIPRDMERRSAESFRDQGGTRAERQRAAAERAEADRVAMARAERLAALVNAGQCAEAHRTAIAEGDAIMANRIAQVCQRED